MKRLSHSLATLVVTSSIALLTGAQATTLDFGAPGRSCAPSHCSFGLNPAFASMGVSGTGTLSIVSGGVRTNATFDGLTGGSWQFSPGAGFPASVSGFDGSTFTNVGPNTSTYTESFPGGDELTGNVQITSIQDNTTGLTSGFVTLIGVLTVTSSSGALASNFGGPGSTAAFDFPFKTTNLRFPSVAAVFAGPSTSNVTFTAAGAGSITPVSAPPPPPLGEVPLPGAIYLFGSVLGGAFWLGRRKRSAVSDLGRHRAWR